MIGEEQAKEKADRIIEDHFSDVKDKGEFYQIWLELRRTFNKNFREKLKTKKEAK